MRRALLIGVAVVVAAWFGLGIRQADEITAASSIVAKGHVSAGQAREARGLLSAASVLNPDASVDILRAQLDRDQGDLPGARRILDRVVAREPDDAEAWYALELSSVGSPATGERAWRNLIRLVPPVRASG